jgi:hypothetical protein
MKIYVDFKKLNATTKKDIYLLHFTDEVINIITKHGVYTFLDGFFEYHQISIAPKDQHKIAFVIDWGVVIPFGIKNGPPTYQKVVIKVFHEYIDVFMKIFLDDFRASPSLGGITRNVTP